MVSTLNLRDRLMTVGDVRVFGPEGVSVSDPRVQATSIGRDLARMGWGRGDRLAAVLPNGHEFVAVFLACLQAEISFVPIHPALSEHDVKTRCRAARVSGVWTPGQGLCRFAAEVESPPKTSCVPATIFFTSGTEGQPRAVAVSAHALMHVADTHHQALGYARGVEIVGFLPWSHAFGFTLELLMALLYEATLRTVPPSAFPQVLESSPGDILFTVPRMLERLPDAVLQRLRGGIVGGAPVRGQVRRRLEGTQLRVGYGQTECAPGVSLGEAGEWPCDDFLGRALGCEVALRAGASEGIGELALRGPNLAMGYVEGEALLPVVSADGWRLTGDLATASAGAFIFQGRKDELFKLDNGRMVNPVPLEVPYDGQILLIGDGCAAVQPLARGEIPPSFALPIPHLRPRLMPEAFWMACTTLTGKVSRRRAHALFYERS